MPSFFLKNHSSFYVKKFVIIFKRYHSFLIADIQWNLSTKAMFGVKSFDPCREFGCFQSLFFIVVDHCVPFTLAVVKSQVVPQSPFVERFMYTVKLYTSLGTK